MFLKININSLPNLRIQKVADKSDQKFEKSKSKVFLK
jgi:hypothetical protein